jgi:hypothetical protein
MEVHQVRELQLRIQTQHRAVCSQLRILMSWPRLRAPLKAEAHHRRYEEAPNLSPILLSPSSVRIASWGTHI